MIRKLAATVALTGALTAGSAAAAGLVGTAGAATPAASNVKLLVADHRTCAKAPVRLSRIAKLEARAQAWVPKAEQRMATAQEKGNTTRAARITRRIKRVERLEARGSTRQQKIEAACPGS